MCVWVCLRGLHIPEAQGASHLPDHKVTEDPVLRTSDVSYDFLIPPPSLLTLCMFYFFTKSLGQASSSRIIYPTNFACHSKFKPNLKMGCKRSFLASSDPPNSFSYPLKSGHSPLVKTITGSSLELSSFAFLQT